MGSTVIPVPSIEPRPIDHMASIRELTAEMASGAVDVLVILGGNPVFDAPADLKFAEALKKVGLAVHLSLSEDETSELCHWNIPLSHALESWSDARAYDGTVSIVQPLIAPLYGSRTEHEIVASLTPRPERTSYEIVREYWLKTRGLDEKGWRRALHDGFVADTAGKVLTAELESGQAPSLPRRSGSPDSAAKAGPQAPGNIEIQFRPDPTIGDGRFANNGWLQELPKPLTKLTWDSAAYVSPKTAERLGVATADVVELRANGRSIRTPILIVPGHAADSVTVHLGYGRRRAGRVGTGVGFDAYPLRTSDAPWTTRGEIVKTGERYDLATTQNHFLMENRNVVRVATVEEYKREPEIISHMGHTPPKTMTLYPEYEYTGNRWGMAIDLDACTGCNACVVACQAENNVPVVGKSQVMVNREMHWLRVDTYYRGDLDNPETYHQPVPCMQCENAPCEVVCPVAATAHSAEGLNDMVYNRCVGTEVLLEQLSLQGAPVQLPPVPGFHDAVPATDAQPGRHGPEPRRHGEVHLLRAADQRVANHGQERRTRDPGRRDQDRVPADLSGRRHRLRQPQRPEQPRREAEGRTAQLRAARRPQHAATDDVSGGAEKSEPGVGATVRYHED